MTPTQSDSRLARLAQVAEDAARHAPAFAARLREAGLSPADLAAPGGLDRLPVLKKERLMALQAADPPFAGFLSCPIEDVDHIYVSPGPIFEPVLKGPGRGCGFDLMFRAAGIGPGDIALNTWNYHLVPAGLLFGQGARDAGASVIPSGPGQTDLQVQLMARAGVTAFLGSTAYFETVADAFAETHGGTKGVWSLTRAFLGGEPGDWYGKRRRLEAAHGITTHGCYGTADVGLVGFEEDDRPGYSVHPERLVQICDPETGKALEPGVPGEIVVSTLARGWPMIRFGTGDLARAETLAADGFVSRLGPVEGRVGAGVKVREIFIYPAHLGALAARLDGVEAVRARITRQAGKDHIALEYRGPALPDARIADAFQTVTRLRADTVVRVETFTIETEIDDARRF